MKNILYILSFIAVSYKATAQITYIPDQGFEQVLIDLEIDSDGIINGQIFTSDVEHITFLEIYNGSPITDLTGIEDFAALEKFSLNYSNLTEIDLSQNTQLKILNISQNLLTRDRYIK